MLVEVTVEDITFLGGPVGANYLQSLVIGSTEDFEKGDSKFLAMPIFS